MRQSLHRLYIQLKRAGKRRGKHNEVALWMTHGQREETEAGADS